MVMSLQAAKQLVQGAVSTIERRARGMVRRAVLNALSNDGELATGQLELTEDEQVDQVELISPPGLSFRPEGAEAIVLAVGGDPSNLAAIPYIRGKRLTGDDLAAGEVALFIGNAGQVVRLKSNGDVVVTPKAGSKIYLGDEAATQDAAVAQLVKAALDALGDAVAAWVPVAMDGGAALKPVIAAWKTALGTMAATKVKVV